jgi:peptide/nickel transport system substrate-binding protein
VLNQRRSLIGCSALLAVALLVCVVALLFTAVISNGNKPATAQAAKNRIVYGLTLMPSGFDPHVNSSSEMGIPLRSVYDTLLYRDPQTKAFVAGLAEKWSMSADGLTYTFNLKQGVKFHDGTPFDANAVAANLDRITAADTKSQKAKFLLGPFDHYTVVDPQTIQIVLKTPYAPFLDGLCQVYTGIASPTALKQYDLAQYQYHQIGTGPFIQVDYVPGDHMTLRRNPDYKWGPAFYNAPTANSVDEIEFRFFVDPPTRAPALESNAVQIVGELAPTDALVFSGNTDVRLLPQAIPGEPLQFLFNTTKEPTDNVEVRKALITATNRAAIVDSIFQQFSPVAYGPLSAVTPFYDEKVKTFYNYDAAAAISALSTAGYMDSDGDKFLDKGGTKLSLTIVSPPWGFSPQVAQKLQSLWRDLGIDLVIKQVPNFIGLLDAAKSGEYNLIAYDDFGLDASVLNVIYASTAPTKWTNYADGNIDSWLTRATEALEDETRKNMYIALQNGIMEQALTLPIRDYVNLNGVRTNIGGLSFDAYGWFPLLANLTINDSATTPTS